MRTVQLAAWVTAEARRRRQLGAANAAKSVHPAAYTMSRSDAPSSGEPTTPPPRPPSTAPRQTPDGAGVGMASIRILGAQGFSVLSTFALHETLVDVSGELDVATAPELEKELLESLSGPARRVVVNLAATTFLDSHGLGALIAPLRVARERSVEIVLQSPSRSVRKVLEISGAAQLFRVVD